MVPTEVVLVLFRDHLALNFVHTAALLDDVEAVGEELAVCDDIL